jgi:hypothetical protein
MILRSLPLALALSLFSAAAACGTIATEPDSGTADATAVPPATDGSTQRDSSITTDANTPAPADATPVDAADAASRERTCETEAIVRFENCLQSADDAGPAPIAQTIVSSRIAPGANGAATCALQDQPWVAIGAYGADGGVHRVVRHGQTEAGDRVDVTCSVVSQSDGSYLVRAEAARAGAGKVRVAGTFRAEKAAPQPNIAVTLERADLGTFAQTDCVASYDANPLATVASGRVWFRVTCPRAVSPATP